MTARRYSSRAMFYVVSFITLVLLLGSAALQRVVFKADQVASALSVSPANISIKPDAETTVQVTANFTNKATVTAAEIGLNFDPSVAEIVSTKIGSNWRLVKEQISNGVLRWVMVPITGATVIEVTGDVVLGEIVFKGTAEGRAVISFNSTQTRIAAVDPTQTPSLYNSVATTQTAVLNVATNATSTKVSTLTPDTQILDSSSGIQHFRSITELVGSTTSQIFVATDQPAVISVLFGPDPHLLLNSVVASSSQSENDLQLTSLEGNSTYYYQIRADMSNGESILSKTRSFHTSAKSAAAAISTDAIAFPAIAAKNSTVYFVSRDQSGAVVENLQPALTVESGSATVGSVTNSGGIYRGTVTTNLASQQKVVVGINSNDQAIGSTTISFDPNAKDTAQPTISNNEKIDLSTTTALTLLGLAFLLVVLVSLFLRLARVR